MVLILGTTFSAMGVQNFYIMPFLYGSEYKLSLKLFHIFQKIASENLQ